MSRYFCPKIGMAANSGGFQPGDARINRNGPAGKHGRGFAQRVRAATKDGAEPLEFALRLMRGEILDQVVTAEGGIANILPPAKVRFQAAVWLVDRGVGKSPDIVDEASPLEGKSDEEQLQIIADALPESHKRMLATYLLRQLQAEGAAQ